jgi:hypothetical protein
MPLGFHNGSFGEALSTFHASLTQKFQTRYTSNASQLFGSIPILEKTHCFLTPQDAKEIAQVYGYPLYLQLCIYL